jgi:hypothetical protein
MSAARIPDIEDAAGRRIVDTFDGARIDSRHPILVRQDYEPPER